MSNTPFKLKYNQWLVLLIASILVSGCGSYSSMQTARVVPKGESELGLGVFYPQGVINALAQVVDEDRKAFSIPYFQATYKLGLAEKLDAGINLSTFGQLGIEGKYQLIGTGDSQFAMSTGFGVNTFFNLYYDFQIPLHLSVHPIDKLGIYVTPKYIGQFISRFSLATTYFDYAGFSAGLMYGDRTKIGLDITAAFPIGNFYAFDIFPNLYNFGIGAKWTLGRKKEASGIRF